VGFVCGNIRGILVVVVVVSCHWEWEGVSKADRVAVDRLRFKTMIRVSRGSSALI